MDIPEIGSSKNMYDPPTSLETDEYYRPEITPEELIQELSNNPDPNTTRSYFNNFHLHIIDPMYYEKEDPEFQQDLETAVDNASSQYWTDTQPFKDSLIQTARATGRFSKEQFTVLASAYIQMRNLGYLRYTKVKGVPCLVR
jgi:hypothetical protein